MKAILNVRTRKGGAGGKERTKIRAGTRARGGRGGGGGAGARANATTKGSPCELRTDESHYTCIHSFNNITHS